MADPERQETPANSDGNQSSGGAIGLTMTMAYITSIPGILKIVEFFTLKIAFALAADVTDVPWIAWGRRDFFLFVTVTSWIVVMEAFVLFALNVISKINLNIDWNIPVLVFAVIATLPLLVSSSLIADDARKLRPLWSISIPSSLDKLRAAAAFGFISMFVFIADGVVHLLKMKRKDTQGM